MTMSSIIGFLENVGRDVALRHASRSQLRAAMEREHIAPALLDRTLIGDECDTRHKIYCMLFPEKPPQKAPSKKPSKAPKKAPAKKPSKKPGKSKK
jgi:hypothetical protein